MRMVPSFGARLPLVMKVISFLKQSAVCVCKQFGDPADAAVGIVVFEGPRLPERVGVDVWWFLFDCVWAMDDVFQKRVANLENKDSAFELGVRKFKDVLILLQFSNPVVCERVEKALARKLKHCC